MVSIYILLLQVDSGPVPSLVYLLKLKTNNQTKINAAKAIIGALPFTEEHVPFKLCVLLYVYRGIRV